MQAYGEALTTLFTELRRVQGSVIQPSREDLREMAKHDERTTNYGSAAYFTKTLSRSGSVTTITTDDGTTNEDALFLKKVKDHLSTRDLIQIDRVIGSGPMRCTIRVLIPKEYARIAYGWTMLLWDHGVNEAAPDIVTIDLPDWKETRILIDPVTKTNIVCGSDYIGELKMSGLRLAMYAMKEKGGLGLHAGSKKFILRDTNGATKELGCLLFGLSGTGKTTLTCHHCGIHNEGEGQVILQDDIVLLDRGGQAYGTEDNFYVKTMGVEPEHQKIIYDVLVRSDAVLENVVVRSDGTPDFLSDEVTSNTRACVNRSAMAYTKPNEVDLANTHRIFFITRNDAMPPIARLSPLQAAKMFMLGETVETGAGDPTQIGVAKRVVGFSPFIIGSPGEEGNRFLEIIEQLPELECYVVNTGEVDMGATKHNITIAKTTEFIASALRGNLVWKKDPHLGIDVPATWQSPAAGFSPGEYEKKIAKLEADRQLHLAQFQDLREDIRTT